HICNPSDWYGGLPIVFFFPELAASLLRAYAHFQLTTGEIPLGIGDGSDLEKPEYRVIPVMNSMVHAQLVDRLWQRDLNPGVLHEFYPSVKRALQYTQGLDRDGDGLPDLDPDPIANHYYGNWPWHGAAIHVAGLWLATLQMAARMARAVGDSGFAQDCQVWFETGSRWLEQKLWNGEWYLLYHDSSAGKTSDTILANQLAGQLFAYVHGLQQIVRSDRVNKVLTTVKQRLVPATPYGVVNALRPDGSFDTSGSPHSDGIFTGECVCVAMTMGYAGDGKTGNEIAERQMQNIIFRQGAGWDMRNIVHSVTGKILHGHYFNQMMILWGLPLALSKQSIHQACQSDGLIGRVLSAARVTTD
ncbi:MAG: GH116 family glycosyl hydrolase, partial [Syntrophobacteraceae bacterium]